MIQFTLEELAKRLDGQLSGPGDIVIHDVSGLDDPKPGTIAYVSNPNKVKTAEGTLAAALLIPVSAKRSDKPAILVKNPKVAFAKLLACFHPTPLISTGIHRTVLVDPSATLGAHIRIGPYAVIGPRVVIGNHVSIGPFAFIDEDVVIGDHTVVHPRVSLLRGVEVGKHCVLYEGCVIGSQGFGYATDETGKHLHIPQIGTVILEDEVEIGANATIDRAVLGTTRIGSGTKIDNLVQVAHNCQIGPNCLIAALTGLAGSVVMGAGTMIGGRSGARDHAKIGENVRIAGNSDVWGDLESGAFVSGRPAIPHWQQLRITAVVQRLPELLKRIEALEKGKKRS